MKNLVFVVPNFPKSISLDIRDAEFLYNAMIIGNLVSNLVIPGTDGKFSPGMAESWSQDGNKWTFKLRKGHTCENGEPITASGFRRSFLRAFKSMAKKRAVPVFDQLIGFKEFLAGDEAAIGLVADGENLRFEFQMNPDRGFIEYLAFPSLGYACEANFKGDDWADTSKFISSGAFTLSDFQQGEKIVLKKREGWYRQHQTGTVTIQAKDPEFIEDNSATTILTGSDIPVSKPGFELVKEIPQSLGSVNIEPFRDFADIRVRRILADKIIEVRERTPFENALASKTSFFFAGHQTPIVNRPPQENKFKPSKPLKILVFPNSTLSTPRKFMESLTLTALEELGWPFQIERFEERTMEIISSKNYDIKQFVAEVGGGIEEWIVSMHFCGALGGHYPDPDNKICNLTKDFKLGKTTQSEYEARFNQLLYDSASVVPIFSSGSAWLVSNDIDHAITPVMTLPRFDEIVFRND